MPARDPKQARDLRVQRTSSALRETLLSVPVALALLLLSGWVLAATLFRNIEPTPEALEALRQTLIPTVRSLLAPEPLERSLFLSLVLLGPICIVTALDAVRWVQRNWPASAAVGSENRRLLAAYGTLAAAVCALFLLHGNSVLQFYFLPGPILDAALIAAGVAALFWLSRQGGVGKRNQSLFFGLAAFQALLVFLPRGFSIHTLLSEDPTIASHCWAVHFQAAAYAVTQVYAGKPLLSAAPPLYGCYAAFLGPVFKLTGLSLFKFCLTMSLLLLAAQVSVLLIAWRFIRIRAILILCCLALFYTTAGGWCADRLDFDPYFQYWPVRYLFPALSVPLFLWALRRSRMTSFLSLGAFCGLSLMWNLETGIAVAGATLCTVALETLGRKLNDWPGRYLQLLAIAASGAVVCLLFQAFLWHQTGGVHPLHTTADYQRLFYVGGLTMLALPLTPHPWFFLQIIYVVAFTFGIHGFLFEGRRGTVQRLTTYLAILGEGLFVYYQGRSHDFNLIGVAWPGILVGFVLADRLFRAIRTRLVLRDLRWLALPATYFGIMAGCMLAAEFPSMWKYGSVHWQKTLSAADDPMIEHVAFIRQHTGNDHECVILARLQAAYFMETGLRSQYNAPGHSELCFQSDVDALKKALVETPAHHLFVDAKLLKQFQLTEVIAAHYKTTATTPDQILSYMEPLPNPPTTP